MPSHHVTGPPAADRSGRDRRSAPPPADGPDLLLASRAALLAALDCDLEGLTETEARARLARIGPNVLAVQSSGSLLTDLVRQLIHPLALLLWVAAALALTTQGLVLGMAIISVIALNAAFALVQERHAEHAVAALAEYLPAQATVVRDGQR